jgi:hypothetical protein
MTERNPGSIGRDNNQPESFTEFSNRLSPAIERGITFNRQHGHADTCLFGDTKLRYL